MSKRKHTVARGVSKPNRAYRWLLLGYVVAGALLLLYSYTQVDLNLTITRLGIVQKIQQGLQYIGYFARPLSTVLYVLLVSVFFGLYGVTLVRAKKRVLTTDHIWRIVWVISGVLVLSYPAFSNDIYNYIFTAKTVLIYHKNPYVVLPQEFTGIEPLLSVMRWVHLPSAYTPLWIGVSLVPYILGFGVFLITLWNMKLMLFFLYLVSVKCIEYIVASCDRRRVGFAMVLFALNPLVLVETLVSGHNDIAMVALVLVSLVFYMQRRTLLSWMFLSLSVAMKMMTGAIIPVYLVASRLRVRLEQERFRMALLLSMLAGIGVVLTQREILPWYWVWIMPFVALVPRQRFFVFVSIGISWGLLMRYAPFLYYGHWNDPVPTWITIGAYIPIVLSVVLFLIHQKMPRVKI